MKYLCTIILLTLFSKISFAQDKPKIAFTFDDGSIADMPGYKLEEWNEMLLNALDKNNVKAALFVKGGNLNGEKGNYIISSWNNVGHKIGNHTYSHASFSNEKITTEQFEADFLKDDSIINKYSNFYPYFRFPYLKEGNTKEKIEDFRTFLAIHNYKNAQVSIDASDWYIDSRLTAKLKEKQSTDLAAYKQYYIDHLYNRAIFYDSLSTILEGRKISHVLLLHHNLAAALFLDDLIKHFKSMGWEITSVEGAYQDKIYEQKTNIVPAGESLIWSLAKQSGKFENILRYPAEDGEYEKSAMDDLGL